MLLLPPTAAAASWAAWRADFRRDGERGTVRRPAGPGIGDEAGWVGRMLLWEEREDWGREEVGGRILEFGWGREGGSRGGGAMAAGV